jgi:hypothetical protein
MTGFTYFAYGSNLLVERLLARCNTARFLGTAEKAGYRLAFGKTGKDGSGKATLVKTHRADAVLYGALYEIHMSERSRLDGYEDCPKGYERIDAFQVMPSSEKADHIATTTYIATTDAFDEQLKPFDWYKALVIAGAQQHNFPDHYIKGIQDAPCVPDPNPDRPIRKDAIALLERAIHINFTSDG